MTTVVSNNNSKFNIFWLNSNIAVLGGHYLTIVPNVGLTMYLSAGLSRASNEGSDWQEMHANLKIHNTKINYTLVTPEHF